MMEILWNLGFMGTTFVFSALNHGPSIQALSLLILLSRRSPSFLIHSNPAAAAAAAACLPAVKSLTPPAIVGFFLSFTKFLELDYGVVFLHREGSLEPYNRHFHSESSHLSFLDYFAVNDGQLSGTIILPFPRGPLPLPRLKTCRFCSF